MKKLLLVLLIVIFYAGCSPCGAGTSVSEYAKRKSKERAEEIKKKGSEKLFVHCAEGYKFLVGWSGSWDAGIAIVQIHNEDNKPIKCDDDYTNDE